jgi:hypothetical protein
MLAKFVQPFELIYVLNLPDVEFLVMFKGPFSKKAPIKDEQPGPPSSQIIRLSFYLSSGLSANI